MLKLLPAACSVLLCSDLRFEISCSPWDAIFRALIPLSASTGKLLCSEVSYNIVLKIMLVMDSVLHVNKQGIPMESS